jgi:hypothetical protein
MSDLSSIFTQSHCISKTQMLAYIQQKLDKEEAYLVESHINDCQFCNDALDALIEADLVETEQIIHEAKSTLNQKLFPVLKLETNSHTANNNVRDFEISKKTLSRWLAAASILLLIGLGGYTVFSYIKSNKQELSMNEKGNPKSTYKAPYATTPSNHGETIELRIEENDTFRKYASEKKNDIVPPNTKTTTVQTAPKNLENKPATDIVSKEEAFSEEVNVPIVATSPVKDMATDEPTRAMDNEASQTEQYKAPQVAPVTIAQKKSAYGMKQEKSLNNQQQNQLSYPQNNVNNNIDIVQKNTNPISTQLNEEEELANEKQWTPFEQGMNYFNNKKYKKSIPLFEKALKKAKGIEREDILYHLALAYENTGKYEKSMELYASLSNSQKYRAAVSRKLQEIKTKK